MSPLKLKVVSRMIKLTDAVDLSLLVILWSSFAVLGSFLSAEEMRSHVKHPLRIILAMFCKFAVMPAVGLGICELFGCNIHETFALVISVVCPDEGIFCLLVVLLFLSDTSSKTSTIKENNVTTPFTLAASITLVNCFSSLAFLPIWTIILETRLFGEPGHVTKLPFRYIISLLVFQTLALLFGYALKSRWITLKQRLAKWFHLSRFIITIVILVLIFESLGSLESLYQVNFKLLCLAITIIIVGYGIGVISSFSLGFPSNIMAVITIHFGLSGLLISRAVLQSALSRPESTFYSTLPILLAISSQTISLSSILVFKNRKSFHLFKFKKTKKRDEISRLSTGSCSDISIGGPEIIDNKETCI